MCVTWHVPPEQRNLDECRTARLLTAPITASSKPSSAMSVFSVSSCTTHLSTHTHSAEAVDVVHDVALKAIPKKVKGNEESVWSEMQVLQGLDHPNVVKFYEWFKSRTKHYLAFELTISGELFEHISQCSHFSERDAVAMLCSVLSGVKYLHDIVHRDLKYVALPLFSFPSARSLDLASGLWIDRRTFSSVQKDPSSDLVIADFGMLGSSRV